MPLLHDPAPDFSDPIGLLAACHQRILDHCDLLERMTDWLLQHGVDTEIQAAARRVHRYFDQAAPHHHADEEQDLFPLLLRMPDLADVLRTLQAEHTALDAHWLALEPDLLGLVDGHPADDWAEMVRGFVDAYRHHIAVENERILPAARERLAAKQLQAIGQAMAARRGVAPNGGQ